MHKLKIYPLFCFTLYANFLIIWLVILIFDIILLILHFRFHLVFHSTTFFHILFWFMQFQYMKECTITLVKRSESLSAFQANASLRIYLSNEFLNFFWLSLPMSSFVPLIKIHPRQISNFLNALAKKSLPISPANQQTFVHTWMSQLLNCKLNLHDFISRVGESRNWYLFILISWQKEPLQLSFLFAFLLSTKWEH